jgi:ubiquinone/menaquinone biosynthesis C-methylase UbiE
MIQMDVTRLDFPDESFDAIVCNHVLEHVPDDRKALAEFYRVLKKGGWASIQVPIEGEDTQENLSVSDPLERARLFGQSDHVRKYGRDFLFKLEDAGFSVEVVPKQRLLDSHTLNRISVACEDSVWISRKQ